MLSSFIKIVTTGELDALTKSGAPSETDLANAWDSLFTEYCDITKGKSHIYLLQITREIKYLETRLQIMQICIDRLKVSYYQKACDVLLEYGFNYDFTPESMISDLQSVVAEGQFLVVQLGVKKGEYQKYIEGQKGDTASEQDYISNLAVLSKHQGYQLRADSLFVSEYVAIFNSFKEQNGG